MEVGLIVVYGFLFVALVILILILNPRSSSSVTYVNQDVVAHPMVELCNPFLLQLCSQQDAASLCRVKCFIQTGVGCMIKAFWGVNILDLFSVLHEDYTHLRDQLLDSSLLKESSLSSSALVHESACSKELEFQPETVVDEAVLGSSLRQRYPLVVFIFLSDLDALPSQAAVVGLVSVIHIKDSLVKLDTHIIGQYLKLADNRLCSLSNLYASSDPLASDGGATFCVVCQSEVASMATLPCRHLCTCQNCFSQLQSCPMCRSFIHSYFITRE